MKPTRIEAIMQDYAYTNEKDWKELNELKRLARIGKATEKAYDEDYDINVNIHPTKYRFKNIKSLLEWAESEDMECNG